MNFRWSKKYHQGNRVKFAGLVFSIFCVCIIVLFQSCVYFNIFYNAKRHYRNAEKDNANKTTGPLQPQNYNKAIDTAAKIPELYPESKYVDDALLLMGKCYYKIGNFPKAERKFDEILANYPDSPLKGEAILYKGKCLIANRSFDQAYEVLNQLSAGKTEKEIALDSRFSIGELLYLQEKHLQAADVYLKIIDEYHKKDVRIRAYLKAAECYYKSNKYEEAAEYYLKGANYRGLSLQERFDALYQRTICLRNMEDLDTAEKELRQILKNQKYYAYYPKAKALLAEVLYSMGRNEEAVKLLLEVILFKPKSEESAQSHYLLGEINQRINADYKKAEEYWGKVKMEKADSPYADSAAAALKILETWRGITGNIDSIEILIRKDLNLLAGIKDTVEAPPEKEKEPDLRQLFEKPESKTPPFVPEYQEPNFGQEKPALEEESEGVEKLTDTLKAETGIDTSVMAALSDSTSEIMDSLTKVEQEPAVLDTQKVLDRIRESRQELNSLRYQLAEALHFQMNNTDSSKAILVMLADSADIKIAPKAIFLLAYLAKMENDTSAMDSLNHLLLEKYPETLYAGRAAVKLGLEWQYAAVETGEVIFKQAEKLYYQEAKIEEAFKLYALVDSLYPNSPYASKALFARAYLAQHEMQADSLAIELYRRLAEEFPKDTLGIIGKKRSEKQAVTMTAAVIDTSVKIESEGEVYTIDEVDSIPVCSMDSTQISEYLLSNQYYPQTALSAQKNGKVTLELTVDIYGYTRDIEVLSEVPTGYGFGEAAAEAAANFRYSPGKLGNRPVVVRMEQVVMFKR